MIERGETRASWRVSRGAGVAIALGLLVLGCLASGVALRTSYALRQEPFDATCRGIAIGAPIADVEASFTRIGEATSGHAWNGEDLGRPPDTHSWLRRTGMSRWQQCTVWVDAEQRVSSVEVRAGTDFTDCTDRAVFPRRFWLCRAADLVGP